MSIILGLNCYHTDSSACLIKNGKLVFAIEEERLNRKKHTSELPILSIKECLSQTKTKEEEITDIAFNTNPKSNFLKKLGFIIKRLNFKNNFIKRYTDKQKLHSIFQNKFNFNENVNFYFVEHHLAHIASAFYASKFKKAIGISVDGSGDFVSLMIARCDQEEIRTKKKIYFPDSLGIFYHAMTQFIGFKNLGDEYKVMGLAPYGNPIYFESLINNLFLENKDFFKLNLEYFNHHKINFNYSHINSTVIPTIYSKKLDILFEDEKKKYDTKTFKTNFACSVQKVYEFYFKKIIKYAVKSNFSENLVYAGGCALNSSANNFLISEKIKNNIFIPVAPGDNGGCLGAAFYVCKKKDKDNNFDNPFVGTSFDDHKVLESFEKYKNKITFKKILKKEEKYNVASDMIINNGVIGWFQGKMEFGPRALGNRSILADPRNKNIKELINKKIKRRESFRPFAPSILSSMQSEWFEEKFNNIYMSAVMTPKKNKANLIPGVVHIDNTSRVQSVNREMNSNFYDLIQSFYKKTNVPILLNTSFNESEPIVNTPEEAIECLLRTNMDALFINSFFVKKI